MTVPLGLTNSMRSVYKLGVSADQAAIFGMVVSKTTCPGHGDLSLRRIAFADSGISPLQYSPAKDLRSASRISAVISVNSGET